MEDVLTPIYRKWNRHSVLLRKRLPILSIILLLLTAPGTVHAGQVTLSWDAAEDPSVIGYSVYMRAENQPYAYGAPLWTGMETTCTIADVADDRTSFFVVRTVDSDANESVDSNEVCNYRPLLSFPAEGQTGVFLSPDMGALTLSDGRYAAIHAATQWQISTSSDFAPETMVFETRTNVYLNNLTLPDLILERGTVYYWRVRHFDHYRSNSPWSIPSSFTTSVESDWDDKNLNGIPDDQEIVAGLDDSIDVDADGRADILQNDIWVIKPAVGGGYIGLSVNGIDVPDVEILVLRSIDTPTNESLSAILPNQTIAGISVKTGLQPPGSNMVFTIYISKIQMDQPTWYYLDPASGWRPYEAATIDEQSSKISLTIQDGGDGDDDGVSNGSISHTGGFSPKTTTVALSGGNGGGGGSCFLTSIARDR